MSSSIKTASHTQWARAISISAIAFAVQGCVAMALPAVAGGLIVRGETAKQDAPPTDLSQAPAPAPQTQIEAANNLPISEQEVEDSTETGTRFEVLEGVRALPAPGAVQQTLRSELIYRSGFHEMATYALRQASTADGSRSIASALLANPSLLDATRRPCDFGEPAVLIDLDEKGRVFDPSAFAPTYDGDAYGHLSRLREAGVKIGWTSALTAERAGDVRKALQVSGLDVEGTDALVLLRYPNDRKQTRRAEFGAAHCLIAIAGDDRTDFDELYEYLVSPDAAVGLEPMIGNGWFLLTEGLPAKQTEDAEIAATDEGSVQ